MRQPKNKPTLSQAQVAASTRTGPATEAQVEARTEEADAAAVAKPRRKGTGTSRAYTPTAASMRALVDAGRVRARIAELEKADTKGAANRERWMRELAVLTRHGCADSAGAEALKRKLAKAESKAGAAEVRFLRSLL